MTLFVACNCCIIQINKSLVICFINKQTNIFQLDG